MAFVRPVKTIAVSTLHVKRFFPHPFSLLVLIIKKGRMACYDLEDTTLVKALFTNTKPLLRT